MGVQEKDESEHFSPYRTDGKLVGHLALLSTSTLTRYQVRLRLCRNWRNLFDWPRGNL
jgi:hypothetical protein